MEAIFKGSIGLTFVVLLCSLLFLVDALADEVRLVIRRKLTIFFWGYCADFVEERYVIISTSISAATDGLMALFDYRQYLEMFEIESVHQPRQPQYAFFTRPSS